MTDNGTLSAVSSCQKAAAPAGKVKLSRLDCNASPCLVSAVVKKNKSLKLLVDGVGTHRVGPKQSRSAGANAAFYLGGVQGELSVVLSSFHIAIPQQTSPVSGLNHNPSVKCHIT